MSSSFEQAERAFARTFLNTLSTQPITYANDYQQPPEQTLKRVPVLSIAVPPPPERKLSSEASTSASGPITITFKSLKPSASLKLSVQPTDSIASIKAQIAAQPSAPPADAQRLLLKGKALSDTKLLKEYTNIKDGDTVNLMVKPGFDWDPTAPTPSPAAPSEIVAPKPMQADKSPFGSLAGSLDVNAARSRPGKHTRIPSVVLSPSPSNDTPAGGEKDIVISLDDAVLPSPTSHTAEALPTYHKTISNPEFWVRLYEFLVKEFTTDADLHIAFEDFLCASKGTLSPSEIAKIRDTVGIIGMAGT
ncbi:hypothetical protein CVT24_003194 [Panaeolus cyanescens]|uniref:Ubiquitin-like domain-containing protein n=1 Tax=Panaeolus cyanescens TaxID=181874 RepID=A0A409YXF5_9AGAR|nr:hypothetical protein CVT24_003194 [Panaeolus cyanescens]